MIKSRFFKNTKYKFINDNIFFEAIVTQGHKDSCGFDPPSREGIIIYKYFHLFVLARQKPGIEFCYSTCNASSATQMHSGNDIFTILISNL